MDTNQRFQGMKIMHVKNSNNPTISYLRVKHLATKKKFWVPVVGKKALRGLYFRKRDAENYAIRVMARYARLLDLDYTKGKI